MTRRRRRVVAPPRRLGASEEGDLTALAPRRATPPAPAVAPQRGPATEADRDPQPDSAPAPGEDTRRGPVARAAGDTQRGTGDASPPADAPGAPAGPPTIPDRAAADTDEAWGEPAGDGDDARILREKPPHWR